MARCASAPKATLRPPHLPLNCRPAGPTPLASGLEIDAQLLITWNGHDLQLAAAGTYLIVNIPSQRVLDELTAGPPKPPGYVKPLKTGREVDPLQQLNDLMRRLGLVLDLRVGGKTYVTFGVQRTPKITLNAVLGKIGSFFR